MRRLCMTSWARLAMNRVCMMTRLSMKPLFIMFWCGFYPHRPASWLRFVCVVLPNKIHEVAWRKIRDIEDEKRTVKATEDWKALKGAIAKVGGRSHVINEDSFLKTDNLFYYIKADF